MKVQDVFGLVVRIIGVVFFYQGLSSVPNAINSICPAFPHFLLRNIFPSLLLVGWPLLIGVWLIKGAPWLMRLAYGNAADPSGNRDTLRSSAPKSVFE